MICNEKIETLKGFKSLIECNFPKSKSLHFSTAHTLAFALTTLKVNNLKLSLVQILNNINKFKNILLPYTTNVFSET